MSRIADVGTYVTVPADWGLMGEGTSADKAYLLISGEVSVRKDGKEIAKLGPGDIFGEMGIVAHRLRTATVVSLIAPGVPALHPRPGRAAGEGDPGLQGGAGGCRSRSGAARDDE